MSELRKVAVLSGDGIGPEIMQQAIRVLKGLEIGKTFEINFAEVGGAGYDKYGVHYPDETHQLCEKSDAILFGSVGGPIQDAHLDKWKNCEANSILALRKNFQLSVNLRPAQLYPSLIPISPLKQSVVEDGIDILIIRELVGDIYFGEHKQFVENNRRHATDLCEYNEDQIRIAAHQAFKSAQYRQKKVTSVDKANVLATSKLWREVLNEVANDYPDVTLEHMLVDNCAMQLILNPKQFDVIVTGNLFGDILSDAASVIPGSLGLMPSASFNQQGFGLYEPSGGSAPDLAGKNVANPIGQILSLAMMLRYSFDLNDEAIKIENAVKETLDSGLRTQDLWTSDTENLTKVSTQEMTDAIIEKMS